MFFLGGGLPLWAMRRRSEKERDVNLQSCLSKTKKNTTKKQTAVDDLSKINSWDSWQQHKAKQSNKNPGALSRFSIRPSKWDGERRVSSALLRQPDRVWSVKWGSWPWKERAKEKKKKIQHRTLNDGCCCECVFFFFFLQRWAANVNVTAWEALWRMAVNKWKVTAFPWFFFSFVRAGNKQPPF